MSSEIIENTTYYLEMTDPGQLRPKNVDIAGLEIQQAQRPMPELNRFLYMAVGRQWHWVDRLSHTRKQWLTYLDRADLETWVAYLQGTPAGYFELELQENADVEIKIFGILPGCVGQGLGGHLLTFAIRRGWDMGASRVWVHTCSLDHPVALRNYLARGFKQYDQKVHTVKKREPGSWSA